MSFISDAETATCTTTPGGTKSWWQRGLLHREDGPAVEYADGTKQWYQNNRRHRTDGPAIEYANGSKEWYQRGLLHREDGPAVEFTNGTKYWYQNGRLHREDGPSVEQANGSRYWYQNGTRLLAIYNDDDVEVVETYIPNRLVEEVSSKLNFPDKMSFCNWLAFSVLGQEGAQAMEEDGDVCASALLSYLKDLDEYVDMPFSWWYAILRGA